jgi:hypothetical protein
MGVEPHPGGVPPGRHPQHGHPPGPHPQFVGDATGTPQLPVQEQSPFPRVQVGDLVELGAAAFEPGVRGGGERGCPGGAGALPGVVVRVSGHQWGLHRRGHRGQTASPRSALLMLRGDMMLHKRKAG